MRTVLSLRPAGLVRHHPEYSPSPGSLRFLLTWVYQDISHAQLPPPAFTLLRALLDRHVIVPEIYDVMDGVLVAAVQTTSSATRQTCASLYLQFFLDYPLGDSRIRETLQVVLRSLEYDVESGRA